MRLPKFEYLEPKTIEEARCLLSQYKGKAFLYRPGGQVFDYAVHSDLPCISSP